MVCRSAGKRRRRRNFLHRNSVTILELIASNYQRRLSKKHKTAHTQSATCLKRLFLPWVCFLLQLRRVTLPSLVGAPDDKPVWGLDSTESSGFPYRMQPVDSTFLRTKFPSFSFSGPQRVTLGSYLSYRHSSLISSVISSLSFIHCSGCECAATASFGSKFNYFRSSLRNTNGDK
jgi:hypothetical protein